MSEDQHRPKDVLETDASPSIEGVNVVGYLTGEMGLGEVARQYTTALKTVGIPVSTKTLTHFGNRSGHEFAELESPRNYPVNLICLQPLELIQLYREVGEDFFKDRRSIGVWGWELNTFPDRWLDALELLDEVWVWTDYVAETLGRLSTRPVTTIPIPVTAPEPGDATVDLGVPEGFRFIFVFDFHSVVRRKNPLGVIEAFKRAFAPGEGPQLIIKSINGDAEQWVQHYDELKAAALGRPDVHLVDRYLSGREKNALMAGCDCYVSLHRSEGFGLTPAEAMALGKPVIATNFSGTTDFMNDSNSYLVDYTMTQVGPGSPPYPPEGLWADPDLDHAARLMRRVWENQDEARERGERARRDIENNLSHEAVGKRMLAGLERAVASPPRSHENGRIGLLGIDANHGNRLQTIRQMIEHGPHTEGSSKFGRPGRLARRLMLRGIQPFTFYQKKVDEQLVNAMQATARAVGVLKHQARRQREQNRVALDELDAKISRRFDELDAKLSEIVGGMELGSVPLRETHYLGRRFVYPYDSEIGGLIAAGDEWDAALRPIVSELLPEDEPTICEVGSNIGASLLQILAAKPRARVVAFEPSARFRPFLERNLELAGVERVEVLRLLLGREPGSASLYTNSTGASVVSAEYDDHQPRGGQPAEMTTLDEVFRDRDRVDFIKMNTDGFEVLRGAEATIRRDLPVLYFELEPHLLSKPAADLSWLQGLGYRKLVCVAPRGAPQGRVHLYGTTEDPEQAVSWAQEKRGLCAVLACPEGSTYEARLDRIGFERRLAKAGDKP